MGVPRVAALHDISGLGRCSLTAAIPILAAMGVQACPMPTAVLSNQTGYESFASEDLTRRLPGFLAEWKRRGVRFAGVFTGFLCSPEQAAFAGHFLAELGGAGVKLVDPVLGDNGALYPVFDEAMRAAVAQLVTHADVITPNITEACLLTGLDYAALTAPGAPEEPVWEAARRLAALGPHTVIITGVHAGEHIRNFCWQSREHAGFCVDTRRVGPGYSGTGDVLASVLCGGLVRGDGPRRSLELAAQLLERAIGSAHADGADPNDGVAFEEHLGLLVPGEREERA